MKMGCKKSISEKSEMPFFYPFHLYKLWLKASLVSKSIPVFRSYLKIPSTHPEIPKRETCAPISIQGKGKITCN
jgi:hypothetical protein